MPINYNEYPANWKTEIRPAVMKRAGEIRDAGGKITTEAKCEQCAVVNHSVGYRTKEGAFILLSEIMEALDMRGYDYFSHELKHHIRPNGSAKKDTTIVLTIAHLDHDKENEKVDISRLRAWCQRCHLGYDLPRHMEKARKSRENKKGLQNLFK